MEAYCQLYPNETKIYLVDGFMEQSATPSLSVFKRLKPIETLFSMPFQASKQFGYFFLSIFVKPHMNVND